MGGDIEKNRGPCNIAEIVQAFFSQSNVKFGVTQGIQCNCVNFYSVFFTF